MSEEIQEMKEPENITNQNQSEVKPDPVFTISLNFGKSQIEFSSNFGLNLATLVAILGNLAGIIQELSGYLLNAIPDVLSKIEFKFDQIKVSQDGEQKTSS